MTERDLFIAALQLDPSERPGLLDRECHNDPALRFRIERLLTALANVGSSFDPDAGTGDFEAAAAITTEPERVGTIIGGRYKLLERIGEGGMGLVWVAEQTAPVKRKVALKLIKLGMDSRTVLARFEAERQALALMDHPNIAKVLDGGLTDSGRPYFVMEYVKGVPITEYCDSTRLRVNERLHLFVQVCQAVQHAHQKGIIHRDLKPSNILVAPYDDKPVPKVIDFGLAKAMHQSLTERTLHTAHESVLGTPLYMSPEQAQLNNLDVDTRTDIYSLGVLLYELLTGTTPLERQRFKEAAWDEIRRIIREEEPPRPSARLSSTSTLPSLAACRQTEPAKLTKQLRGELDWIVMKALEKDRTRRYETANGLARDIQHYLVDEIVEARPPSAKYRLRKFVRRHKGQVLAASLVLFALLAGVAGTTWGLIRADEHRLLAEQARFEEQQRADGERLAKLEADAKRTEAETQQARAEAGEKLASQRLVLVEAEKKKAMEETRVAQAMRDFLQNKLLGLADVRAQANALLKAGKSSDAATLNPTIRELLDRAAAELAPETIEASFPKQPLLQAELLQTIGVTYHGIGEHSPAIALLTRALALRKAELGDDHAATLHTLHNLALAYWAAGKLPQAAAFLQQEADAYVKKFGAEHPSTLYLLATVAIAEKKHPQAIALLEKLRDAQVKTLGADHPDTLTTLDFLADAYRFTKKLRQAIELFEKVRDARVKKLGASHPDVLDTLSTLALTYQDAGKLPQAIELLQKVRDTQVTRLGADHPDTLKTIACLGRAHQVAGNLAEAVLLFEQAASAVEKRNYQHYLASEIVLSLCTTYEATHQFEKAEIWERKWLGFVKQRDGAESRRYAAGLPLLAFNLIRQKKYADAEPILREWLLLCEMLVEKKQTEPLRTLSVKWMLKQSLLAQNPHKAEALDKAEVWRRKCLAILNEQADSLAYTNELVSLGLDVFRHQQYADAETILRECQELREKLFAKKQAALWQVAEVKSLRGDALLRQNKPAEAEPLLVAGYEGLRQDEKAIPGTSRYSRMTKAIQRLIDLYTMLNKPDDVRKWQAEKAKYQ